MAIDYSDTIRELKGKIDISACREMDAAELISAAGRAVETGTAAILAWPEYVHTLWGWLEGKGIEIFAEIGRPSDDHVRLAEEINTTLRRGADGAAIRVGQDLAAVASALFPVRHDLFFCKKLLFVLDLENADPNAWSDVFFQLKKIGADGIVLSTRAMANANRKKENVFDTPGAVFGALSNWDDGFAGDVWFEFNSINDIESSWRLVKKMRPELIDRTRFIVDSPKSTVNGN